MSWQLGLRENSSSALKSLRTSYKTNWSDLKLLLNEAGFRSCMEKV